MSKVFYLPYIYVNDGKPPRARLNREFGVSSVAPFTFQEMEASELRTAMTFIYRSERDGAVQEHKTPIMRCADMLVRPVTSELHRDNPVTEDLLTQFGSLSPRRMEPGLQSASGRFYYRYGETFSEDSVNPDKVVSSGRNKAIAEIQHKIDENYFLCDGMLYSRCPDPSWNFHVWGNAGWEAQALLVPRGTFTLPGDCEDLVREVADWSRIELGRDITIKNETSIEVHDLDLPFSTNPVVSNAVELANRAELNVVNHDFFGHEVKETGQAFLKEKTVANAMAFLSAFEEAATRPDAHEMGGGLPNQTWFKIFWKLYEVTPEGYKLDDDMGAAITLD